MVSGKDKSRMDQKTLLNPVDFEELPELPAPPPRQSASRQMAERLARRRLWRRFVALAYIVLLTAYLAWRYTIINPDSLALSAAYYAAEVIGFVLGLCAILTSWSYSHRDPPPAPEGLSVDVFVPAYKEPLHIIRRTVLAARGIRYPHGTFLLDDGKRDEVRALAEELGVKYLRREGNLHAKAGNLNYGLARSTADFVMVFDADHIALPHALDAMLGFFADEKVAMVQTPQDYYNIDAFQYINARRTGALWHDQSAFYNIAQPCADSVNAASCVGTGVVYRRAALDAVGGIPTATVTEDIHTSLRLHKAGYKTVFLNESVAYGVAASDLGEYYKTRHRWGHGNLHALKLENILFCKELTLMQRLHYLSLGLIYLEGWQQLLLFTIPLIALVFGLQPFTITIFNVLVVLTFPFLSYLLLQELGCGFARYWANELFAMARWPVYLASTAGLFGRKMAFKSSSKNIHGRINWRLMTPQILVMAASLLAVGYAVMTLAEKGFRTGPLAKFIYLLVTTWTIPQMDLHGVMAEGYTVDLVVIAGAWALYSAVRGGFFIRKVLHDARNTHDYFRFRIPVPALLDSAGKHYGCVTRLSEDWVRLSDCRAPMPVTAGGAFSFTAFLPAGPLRLTAVAEKVTQRNGAAEIEGRLSWESEALRDRLASGLYSVDWHREFLHRNAYFLTPSDVLLSCLFFKPPLKIPRRAWRAVLLETKEDMTGYGVLAREKGSGNSASLVTFRPLASGQSCRFLEFTENGPRFGGMDVTGEESLHSLVEEGLDGAAPRRYAVRLVA